MTGGGSGFSAFSFAFSRLASKSPATDAIQREMEDAKAAAAVFHPPEPAPPLP